MALHQRDILVNKQRVVNDNLNVVLTASTLSSTLYKFDTATAKTVTISAGLPEGIHFYIQQVGTGIVTIDGTAVTPSYINCLAIGVQSEVRKLYHIGNNIWNITRADISGVPLVTGGGTVADTTTCIVTAGSSGNFYADTSLTSGSFNRLFLPTIEYDPGNNWNVSNQNYLVPSTGLYNIAQKFRLNDSVGAGQGFCFGAGPTLADGTYMLWSQTNNNRNGAINERTAFFTAGSTINFVYYMAFTSTGYTAEMVIRKLS